MILDTTSTMDMVTSPESGYESEKDIVREKEIEDSPSKPDTQKSSRKQISSTRKVSSMICPVCGDMATSHRHYGGLSCLSCKAFFRRAVTSSNKKEKRCHHSASLTGGKKRACPACRLRKCLDSGMKTELVLSGRKEALKHIGRAKESTLARLKKLLEENEDEHERDMNTEDEIERGDVVTDEPQNLSQKSDITNNVTDEIVVTKSGEIVTDIISTQEPDTSSDQSLTNHQHLSQDKETSFISSLGPNFFMSCEKLSMFSSRFSVVHLLAESSQYSPALVFTSLQDYMVQLVVMFLKHNQHFQSHSWVSQAKLLRKNLPEMTVILLTMCFDRQKQRFRWVLGEQDLVTIRSYRANQQQTVKITKKDLQEHLGEEVTNCIMQAVNTLADLQLPNCILLVLVLVTVFTRDGLFMDKQNRVDCQRAEYLQMVFKYLSSVQSREASSRVTAKLHKTLKILKDFSENIRWCEVNSVIFD